MAQTSVVQIPVDDSGFRAFYELFQKYQAESKELPEGWAELGDTVNSIAAGFAVMTEQLAQQNKERAEQEAAEKRLESAEKKRQQAEQQAQKRRQQAIKDTRALAQSVVDVGLGFAKWATLGGLGGLVGGALSLWGFDRVLHGVADQRRAALGYGVSPAELGGLRINAQRYFDVNSALENIAEAEADPSKRWIFSGFGVNPAGKDPAQLSLEMAAQARRIFMQGHGNEAWARAHGLLDVFSMDELRRMALEPTGEFNRNLAQARRDWRPGQPAYLDSKSALAWQNFLVELDRGTAGVRNLFVNGLAKAEPGLEKAAQALFKVADSAIDRIDWDKISAGIKTFGDYLGSKQFQDDFRTFVDDVGYAANKMVHALELLGLIPDSRHPVASVAGAGGYSPGSPAAHARNLNPLHPLMFGTLKYPWGADPSGRLGAKNQAVVEGFLASQGWSANAQKGILANLYDESRFDPFARGDYSAKTGQYEAYGIGQWHKDRQAAYARMFHHSMESVKDPGQALKEQLRFMQWELTHTFKSVGEELKAARSAYDAGYAVSKHYERPKGGAVTAASRGLQAQISVKVSVPPGHSVATSVNALN